MTEPITADSRYCLIKEGSGATCSECEREAFVLVVTGENEDGTLAGVPYCGIHFAVLASGLQRIAAKR